MRFDSVLADEQQMSNFDVGGALSKFAQDLFFAMCQVYGFIPLRMGQI